MNESMDDPQYILWNPLCKDMSVLGTLKMQNALLRTNPKYIIHTKVIINMHYSIIM